MGRLDHLKQSLRRILATDLSCVLVDYSCPERCGDWARRAYPFAVESGQLSICRVEGRKRFSKPRAHNAGATAAAQCRADHICFMDADTLIEPEFASWCRENAREGTFHVFEPVIKKKDLYGTLLLSISDFRTSGGYDVKFIDWGMEDMELRLRLRLKCELDFAFMPIALATPIQHGNSLRVQFYANKDPSSSSYRNLQRLRQKVRQWTGNDLFALRDATLQPLLGYPKKKRR